MASLKSTACTIPPSCPRGNSPSGPFYAAVNLFEIIVTGKGGHAARPNNVIDTTLTAAALVMNLQSIVSRNTDPQQAAVVSVTSFRTESDAFNVTPETVTLRGTVRTFDASVRKDIEARIKAYGATAVVDWPENGYPVMSNHATETDFAALAAKSVAGACNTDAPRTTGGEDFAYMLAACPGAYIQIGNGPSKGLHHPEYDFNDAIGPIGASYWVTLAEQRMPV